MRALIFGAHCPTISAARVAPVYVRGCASLGPFSAEECEELRESLEVSRVGIERYASRKSIDHLLSIQQDEAHEMCCISGGPLIQRRLASLLDADEVKILCINCIYSSVIYALQPFFADHGRHVSMHHYIQPDIGGLNAAEFVACIAPILFDARYSPYLLASWSDTGLYPSVNGNLLLLSARLASEQRSSFMLSATPDLPTNCPRRLRGLLCLLQPHHCGASLPPDAIENV